MLAAVVLTSDGDAEAQTAPTSIAEQLFLEGKALMQANEYEKACDKFRASYALDLSAYGTLLNLALCHEATNKPATAWAEFRVVAAASEGRRPDRVALAREHEAKLFPKLSYVNITVPESVRVAGLVVRIDGAPLEEAAWNTEISIDPGKHVVEASAPNKLPERSEIEIGAESDHRALTIAPLRDAPPPPPPVVVVDHSPRTRTVVGYALGGIGIAAAGVGVAFGIVAGNQRDEALALCDPERVCANEDARRDATRTYSSARTSANVSTVLVGTGAALVVAGVVLVITGRSSSSSFSVAPTTSGAAALFQREF